MVHSIRTIFGLEILVPRQDVLRGFAAALLVCTIDKAGNKVVVLATFFTYVADAAVFLAVLFAASII